MNSVERLYSEYLEVYFREVGLHSQVSSIYDRVFRYITPNWTHVNIDGVELRFRTVSRQEYQFFSGEIPERDILSDFINELRENDTFVDIGAHLGLYTCIASRQIVDAGKIYAFEPYPPNFDALIENVKANDSRNIVETYNIAMSDSNESVEFFVFYEGVGSTANSLHSEGKNREKIVVDSKRGDELRNQDINPDVVKIDVEGAELKVLKGMESMLDDGIPRVIYCEVHQNSLPKMGGSPDEVKELIEGHGYNVSIIGCKKGKTFWVKATRL